MDKLKIGQIKNWTKIKIRQNWKVGKIVQLEKLEKKTLKMTPLHIGFSNTCESTKKKDNWKQQNYFHYPAN